VNFFPTLSSHIAKSALGLGFPFDQNQEKQLAAVRQRLNYLADRSPYSAGRHPFIQDELAESWWLRAKEIEAKARVERRQSEQLFRLAPRMPGLLIDEELGWSGEARNAQELVWAESRVTQLDFEKTLDGRCVSYKWHGDGVEIYADIRSKPKIIFYVYRLPKQEKLSDKSNLSFDLPDRFTRDLPKKWRTALTAAMGLHRLPSQG
jgi:hypothetical protein